MSTNPAELTFDMNFHAFVLAVPLRTTEAGMMLGQPVIAMNQGGEAQLVMALRAIADDIEARGTDVVGKWTL
ncbi:hypothetical protein SEA_DECURRO_2 [Arthrobacter phage Decurro]|uniref:Uncharacterized protein n=22 Tax=Decurrovirus decurro TaxID=1982105 RepID=A0A0U4B4T9_9CAUD|nr:hypothetical protein SEA_DECURRO_2 [Arthrobacter phage Decurro]ALF00757.1 hypothetical protein SEA_JESSICA_2 [Arthrobacter phage Jessica]ALJ97686.1 hypothetical protein SEA_TYMABREU_2 [Arthrobacter phage TymAbreu]ALY09629.1 hypothetical protein MAGGIE_2 [Arthrobacter phage Maggie]ALY09758.1 hypothetical protein MUTTLIE_2 [Arthrobacter phage Muttlie]ALY10900.1 hypothetical protein YANK_2 [Arthrobacter phage Yank]ANZ52270.1 hypothetical protein SEA_COURTNEY3_2 [Arthrobacter phage Courtney3]